MFLTKSILDTDLYKFTTSYGYMKLYPRAIGTFTFIDRNKVIYDNAFVEEVQLSIAAMSSLKLTKEEKEFMIVNCPFIPQHYWEWLSSFTFDHKKVNVSLTEEGYLSMEVTDYLYRVTLWEVPLLALVSELYNKFKGFKANDYQSKTIEKIKFADNNNILFSEFGTRRRFSYSVQDKVIELINEKSNTCMGTSNCHFAHKYGMKMMGTHPHEWFMFHGAMFGYKQANYKSLEAWSEVYDGDLGIALTDTYTTDVFMDNFSKKLAKLFDGVRHDSGDPFIFANKIIKRYKELGIDPSTKTIIFSDGLDMDKCQEINEFCRTRINARYGIGTNLTNDTGNKAANIVMKLTSCAITDKKESIDCVKLSDVSGKHTGSEREINLCLETLNLK